MTSPATTITRGVHHVGLTAPQLDRAQTLFVDALGFEVVAAGEAGAQA